MIVHALAQRDLLVRDATTKSPFIACLRFSFQTPTHLYSVADFAGGGKLSGYSTGKTRISVYNAKFYLAELVLAIEHLHKYGFDVYYFRSKDILLDHDGHIVLSNFQFSERMDKEENLISEDCSKYMAPEGPSYTRTSVFWSLGALAFDLICGNDVYAKERLKITDGTFLFAGIDVSAMIRMFIDGLLSRNRREDLGEPAAQRS